MEYGDEECVSNDVSIERDKDEDQQTLRLKLSDAGRLLYRLVKEARQLEKDRQTLSEENSLLRERVIALEKLLQLAANPAISSPAPIANVRSMSKDVVPSSNCTNISNEANQNSCLTGGDDVWNLLGLDSNSKNPKGRKVLTKGGGSRIKQPQTPGFELRGKGLQL